jgi:hypothetical protein
MHKQLPRFVVGFQGAQVKFWLFETPWVSLTRYKLMDLSLVGITGGYTLRHILMEAWDELRKDICAGRDYVFKLKKNNFNGCCSFVSINT